jgi:hypothetical protein
MAEADTEERLVWKMVAVALGGSAQMLLVRILAVLTIFPLAQHREVHY